MPSDSPQTSPDALDQLIGPQAAAVAALRDARPVTRTHAEASHQALFAPADTQHASLAERFAVATFVAALHRQERETEFYAEQLRAAAPPALAEAVLAAAAAGAVTGPTGHFPPGPLSAEDVPAAPFTLAGEHRDALGPRLAAALEHAHMLVFHPRDAAPRHLQALLHAGWTTTGIVTLSQVVAFLAFQLRVATGLRALAEAPR